MRCESYSKAAIIRPNHAGIDKYATDLIGIVQKGQQRV